jgi:predicted HicB family RNase H-like nuclease
MGRPRTTDEKRVTTAVRLPESMHERLTKEAETRDVSVNLLVTKAIDAYLEALVPVEELIATR